MSLSEQNLKFNIISSTSILKKAAFYEEIFALGYTKRKHWISVTENSHFQSAVPNVGYYYFKVLFRIHYAFFHILKAEGVFHCVLLILGAKFGIPKNVSLKLHIYAAVVREQKEQAAP